METLRVTLIQTDIVWESPVRNLDALAVKLEKLSGMSDLVILPELFSTGFSMNPEQFAEEISGYSLSELKMMASKFNLALAGSFMAKENDQFYNRGFFIKPEGEITFYDKRHLFRMGDEAKHYTGGNVRPVVSYLGWNICLLICYDLRFPVWSRNRCNEYDLLIYVANWPAPRANVWDVLLKARAIENMSYVCGVNRVGVDGMDLKYLGHSVMLDARGEELLKLPEEIECEQTISISKNNLETFRRKFPSWKDSDGFDILN